ncbi:hypothetical protein [Anatilimnocola floriformis]|uniref:hypothetical protein n=1 Tax=Anatilimnocola floriformis TaxID=2948575 RepID=UPI0020C32295|nr:hypothetical protein [Anatilimnocola floriformis]
MNWGKMGAGLLMVVGGLLWLVLGLMANRLFFYPVILCGIGLFTIASGALGSSE